jgi:hypothetical protein
MIKKMITKKRNLNILLLLSLIFSLVFFITCFGHGIVKYYYKHDIKFLFILSYGTIYYKWSIYILLFISITSSVLFSFISLINYKQNKFICNIIYFFIFTLYSVMLFFLVFVSILFSKRFV